MMAILILGLLGALAALLIFLNAKPAIAPPKTAAEREELRTRMEMAITSRRKIEAIKIYRALEGCALVDAKEAIEQRMGHVNLSKAQSGGAEKFEGRLNERLESELNTAIKNHDKIHAIKLYRTIYGVGLKEAKEAVEALCSKN